MAVNKKTILVTGCSTGGIGAAIAYALANQGHTVFATARDTSRLAPELSSHTNVTALQLDVTSAESVAEAAKAVTAAGKGLHALINNAGVGYTMPLLDVDIDRAIGLYDTNVWGTLRTVQAFSDLLVASRGRVVNISTVGAFVNTPWIGIYNSSKAAVTSLSDNLRIELAPLGVSVVTVMVGSITTPFFANGASFELPPKSRYMAIKETIGRWARGEARPQGGPVDKFAESVVYEIVGEGRSGQVWRGPYAGSIKVASKLPTSLLDRMMATGQGLDELAKSLAK
ncbi:hypothetical protein C8F04DRAFT_240679 [Mycena alexandri]|uniref:NADPH-dependent 1-acyldihydroxyacetone phosphate reductase n=1 Tax=Mycena alexandri TaxID=1745969 RepID=A0AAD6S8M2_9AGAR|nr:hypothetical protein C8F04DRAFT_240679 [Mycena alexandri]